MTDIFSILVDQPPNKIRLMIKTCSNNWIPSLVFSWSFNKYLFNVAICVKYSLRLLLNKRICFFYRKCTKQFSINFELSVCYKWLRCTWILLCVLYFYRLKFKFDLFLETDGLDASNDIEFKIFGVNTRNMCCLNLHFLLGAYLNEFIFKHDMCWCWVSHRIAFIYS